MSLLFSRFKFLLRSWLAIFILLAFQACDSAQSPKDTSAVWKSQSFSYEQFTARHEAGLAFHNGNFYLLGGRRINGVNIYEPANNTWRTGAKPPVEIHHFQPVVYNDAIYIIGAFTGPWPGEKPLDKVLIYKIKEDRFEWGADIPPHRQRGSVATAEHDGMIYLVGGITEGHRRGSVAWTDSFDPNTGAWQALPDAPNARDHAQAAINNHQLYVFGGRNSSHATGQDMDLVSEYGNVFDIATGEWRHITSNLRIPTPRSGLMLASWQQHVFTLGGESADQDAAHNEMESFHVGEQRWYRWPNLTQGRHGTGLIISSNEALTVSGSGRRGHLPELLDLETLDLAQVKPVLIDRKEDAAPHRIVTQFETLELDFDLSNLGVAFSETSLPNPFTDVRVSVGIYCDSDECGDRTVQILDAFYAADGNAAQTSANSGSIWRLRFTPKAMGQYRYQARVEQGEDIVLRDQLAQDEFRKLADNSNLKSFSGQFEVIRNDRTDDSFRGKGPLSLRNNYFYLPFMKRYFIKAGANSPENLLAFEDFDDTYRLVKQTREGEAKVDDRIHRFTPHAKDWRIGDPVWKKGPGEDRGKNLIGAINYLADQGMNSIYFLTMNLDGDGKDVWPYHKPDTFDRFDVSKLAQWEIVFAHMQQRGIIVHLVTQETENETLLDNGDTGRLRKLYYQQLVKRFGHHLGLIWNMGEENGPAEFTPVGQNPQQVLDMARYIKAYDQARHPVFVHTHASEYDKQQTLVALKGDPAYDGLSFQVDKRETVNTALASWRERSRSAGNEWVITMDEVGMWMTGAKTDDEDPSHASLRHHVLWGALMGGAAGVEWYFGAHHPHNDLSSEDWRARHKLWGYSAVAKTLFEKQLPYWKLSPCNELLGDDQAFCATTARLHTDQASQPHGQGSQLFAVYLFGESTTLDLSKHKQQFALRAFDTVTGTEFVDKNIDLVQGGSWLKLQKPRAGKDGVLLVLKRSSASSSSWDSRVPTQDQ